MTLQISSASTAANLICAAMYYFSRSKNFPSKTLSTHITGVALASVFMGSRLYSEKQLKKWFDEHHLDYIYFASSFAIMGAMGWYGKLPTKVNLFSSLIFSGIQTVSYKLATVYFKEPPSITLEQLTEYRTNTFTGGHYLQDQLFPRYVDHPEHSVEYSAYLYIFPEGFMSVLCSNGNHPFFMHLPTVDGTDLKRMRRIERLTLPLSQEAHIHLEALSKKVHVTNLDRSKEDKEWTLDGIPPFICIEGKWHQTPQSEGTTIDWEALIMNDSIQKHDAFEMRRIHPTWEHIAQNPNLRGLSFNHSCAGFNIWVHERNQNVLENERAETTSKIQYYQGTIDYINRFEAAAFIFACTHSLPMTRRGNAINFDGLQGWGNLGRQTPFFQTSNPYQDLPDLIEAFRRAPSPEQEQELIGRFQAFFQDYPWEAHFGVDCILRDQFERAFTQYQHAGNNLVRHNGYIVTRTLEDWLILLRRTFHFHKQTPELSSLIGAVEDYLATNNALRDNTLNALEKNPLRAKRRGLDPLLVEQFQWFFQEFQEIRQRGTFIKHMQDDIQRLAKKSRRLDIYAFCEQPIGNFDLLLPNGSIDLEKLKECIGVLDLCKFHESDRPRQLKVNSETYLRVCAQLDRDPTLAQERDRLAPLLIAEYRWFYADYVPHLEAQVKTTFLADLAQFAQCPRSYTDSTAQIQFETSLSQIDLFLMLRHNRHQQIGCLVSLLDSYVKSARGICELPQDFFTSFQAFYQRVANFIIQKARGYKINRDMQWDWNEDMQQLDQVFVDQPSDGSEYRFDPCNSRNSRDLFRLLDEMHSRLGHLYVAVDQLNRKSYLESPLLEEEIEILEELYVISNEMLKTLNIPLRWDSHLELQKNMGKTQRARAALQSPENYVVYKRIGNHGAAAVDIIPRGESSYLSRMNEFHNAIYA
jgi:hypothetical protein